MTNRTMEFYGQGYGVSAPVLTAVFNGQTIFVGPANNSLNEEPPMQLLPADYDLLFTAEIPLNSTEETANLSVSVSGGTGIFIGMIKINYAKNNNLPGQPNSSGPTGYQVIYPDANSNVEINGSPVAVPDPRPPGLEGPWMYWVTEGGTFTSTVTIPPGLE